MKPGAALKAMLLAGLACAPWTQARAVGIDLMEAIAPRTAGQAARLGLRFTVRDPQIADDFVELNNEPVDVIIERPGRNFARLYAKRVTLTHGAYREDFNLEPEIRVTEQDKNAVMYVSIPRLRKTYKTNIPLALSRGTVVIETGLDNVLEPKDEVRD